MPGIERAAMSCRIAGKGQESGIRGEMRSEMVKEKAGGCELCCKSGNGREGAGYGNGVHVS